MRYLNILGAVATETWAIRPEKLEAIIAFLASAAHGVSPAEHRASGIALAGGPAEPSRAGNVAVLPIRGTICNRIGMVAESSGGVSAERVTAWLASAVADPGIAGIVLDIDSPGGTVTGVPELADRIAAAGTVKPVIAHVNATAASAAYWLASQATWCVLTPSGWVGSIGVIAAHENVMGALEAEGRKITLFATSAQKADASGLAPLSPAGAAAMQERVDAQYRWFLEAVARGRKVSSATVATRFGRGGMVLAQDALAAGMVDQLGTLGDALSLARGAARDARLRGHAEASARHSCGSVAVLEALRRLNDRMASR